MTNNLKYNIVLTYMKKLILIGLFISTYSIFAHGMDEGHVNQFIQGGPLDFIYIGAIHMVTGYDHILFLVGVIFFLTTVKDIFKFITVFTLGHSITLIGATYLGWQMNYFLIDAVIGFSVLYKGFENLGGFKKYLKTDAPNLLIMVFAFGLIHGFGLSTRLQSISIADSFSLSSIISFNVGVELGQIAALLPILLLINIFRKAKSFPYFEKVTNGFLVVAGVLLIVFQLHGYFTKPMDVDYEAIEYQIEAEPEIVEPEATPAHGHSHGDSNHHDH
ncbi:MAG: HupE/UreJ family protein [Leptospirales bacterium]